MQSYHTPVLSKKNVWLEIPLSDDTSIIIKEAEKDVAVWDREGYLKEAEKQFGNKETCEESSSDHWIIL